MNQDKIDYFIYQSELEEKSAIKRLSKHNDNELKKYGKMTKTLNYTPKYSELADDSLKIIQEHHSKRISLFLLEQSLHTTELKNISRVLKLRKKPKLKD